MAKQQPNKKVIATKLLIIVILGLILGISCFFSKPIENALGIGKRKSSYVVDANLDENDLTIHYIDVGQGDSTLIMLPDDTTMLIDAGTSKSGKHIVEYLKALDIKTINYFILTHSDADHCGGAQAVFKNFEIEEVYRPFQISVDSSKNATANEDLREYLNIYPSALSLVETKTYANFITAAYTEKYGDGQSAKVIVHHDGLKIESQDENVDFSFEFFAPLIREQSAIENHASHTSGYPTKYYGNGTAESNNAASPVMLLEYKTNSFVFTGDATEKVEKDFLESIDASDEEKERFSKVDVFAAGHHGSRTSNCEELLNLLEPTYVVVSVGKDNDYGHPTPEFLERVNKLSHSISDYLLRTDTMGDITFGYSEGVLLYKANKEGEGVVVYWWQIALGTFIVISIIVISVKVSKNKATTAKRVVKQTQKVVKKMK